MNLKAWQIGCLGLIAFIVIPTLMFGCSVVNETVTLKQQNVDCDEGWSQVMNVSQRRHDLIPNLVATVKGSANFEHSTLKDVIEARRQVTNVIVKPDDPESMKKFLNANAALTVATTNLANFVREKYPELATTKAYIGLMAQLEGTENRMTVERQTYNGKVSILNKELQTITGGIANKWANVASRKFFEATASAQEAPTVDFGK